MRRTLKKPQKTSENNLSLNERIVMAILAPLFFNFGLLICLSLLALFSLSPISLLRLHSSRLLAKDVSYEVFASGWGWFLILIVLPAIAGYQLGVDKCATLLGHFFYTNAESEKNLGKTAFSWVCLLVIAYAVLKALPHAS